MSTFAIPTIVEVERITALADPVLRNLHITQCYHELALVLAERTGWIANWCAFATWASKQAGQTIRKEDLARVLQAEFGSQPAAFEAAQRLKAAVQRLGAQLEIEEILTLLWNSYDPEAALERSSAAVAQGNLKVFAEIAREFARFYAECLSDTVYNDDHITSFCQRLRPGDPPDGQRYLRQAFLHYYQALFEPEEKSRIELMLLANLEIGYHEQTRLQPEINQALQSAIIPTQEFARHLFRAIRPRTGYLADLLWLLLRLFGRLVEFEAALATLVDEARRDAHRLVTETMMTIELPPGIRLRLGEDLKAGFPPVLQQLNNPALLELLQQIDPTPDSTRGSGAIYWADLPDRLHFIADMFRCYQVSRELFDPPFSPSQTADLKRNRLPTGSL